MKIQCGGTRFYLLARAGPAQESDPSLYFSDSFPLFLYGEQ